MKRLDAASFVEALTAARCWDLANALDELSSTLDLADGTPRRDHWVAASRERLIELLSDEESTAPLGTVR